MSVRWGLVSAAAIAYGSVLISCSQDTTVDGVFTQDEWSLIQTMSPLPDVPADTTNAHADDPKAAALGQSLFFEKDFSGALAVGNDGMNGGLGNVGDTDKVACSDCHDSSHWFIDTRSNPLNTALGADWGPHRAPSLVDACFYQWYHWTGAFDVMWGSPLNSLENPKSMNGSRLLVAHVLYAKYKDAYNAVFQPALPTALDPNDPNASRFPPTGKPKAMGAPDGAWEMMAPADQDTVNRIFSNVGKAIQAYLRTLTSRNAPFDQYVAGNHSAISAQAKKGLELFIGKAGCVQCHSGPFFSDNKFHNTGVPQNLSGPHAPMTDTGRFGVIPGMLANTFNSNGKYSDDTNTGRLTGVAQTPDETGQFRTKDLRQVAELAPYMHAGELATLEDVVTFYNNGGGPDGSYSGTKDPLIVPLNLTADEQTDLVEFLKTLTGDPIPAQLQQNTAAK